MRQRTAIGELRSEADRRSRAPKAINRFQILVYGIVVIGVVLIAYDARPCPDCGRRHRPAIVTRHRHSPSCNDSMNSTI